MIACKAARMLDWQLKSKEDTLLDACLEAELTIATTDDPIREGMSKRSLYSHSQPDEHFSKA